MRRQKRNEGGFRLVRSPYYVYARKWKDWLKKAQTPYSELSEEQKESDRKFARKTLAILEKRLEMLK